MSHEIVCSLIYSSEERNIYSISARWCVHHARLHDIKWHCNKGSNASLSQHMSLVTTVANYIFKQCKPRSYVATHGKKAGSEVGVDVVTKYSTDNEHLFNLIIE